MYPGEKKEIIIAPGCVGGGLSSYLYLKKGVVGFDLELDNYSEKAKLCLTDLTTPELVKEYQKRHYGGIVSVLKEVAGW